MLKASSFPWPIRDGVIIPAVVYSVRVSEKDLGDRSKSNEGQVNVVRQALKRTPKNTPEEEESKESEMNLKVTVLSPYTKQIQTLRWRLPEASITLSTIRSRDGRAILSFSQLCGVMLMVTLAFWTIRGG